MHKRQKFINFNPQAIEKNQNFFLSQQRFQTNPVK